jgi:hypothetical protein
MVRLHYKDVPSKASSHKKAEIKEGEMGVACSTHGIDEKCTQILVRKSGRDHLGD